MKNLMSVLFSLLLILNTNAQTEILIVGTAHDVGKGMENNYTPILEITKEWKPDIICSEFRHPKDEASLINIFGKNYLEKRDSIAKTWNVSTKKLDKRISELVLSLFTKEDINVRMKLRNLYYLNMDRGNSEYQSYLVYHQFMELSEPEKLKFKTQFPMFEKVAKKVKNEISDEYGAVAFPLAKYLGIDYLHPTDDQFLSVPYHDAWNASISELDKTEEMKNFQKMMQSIGKNNTAALANGDAVLMYNSYPFQEVLMKIEYSFFEPGLSASNDLRCFYWHQRNIRMVENILEVVEKNPNKKIVVFYGASHLPDIRKILRAETDYKILTLSDLKSWKKYASNINSKYIVK